jgi:glycosyltransferase involved in cell wall biosynthesis
MITKAELSVVVPARDEAESLGPLLREIEERLLLPGLPVEVIVVDDGSRDETPALLAELARRQAWLVAIRREESVGQSAAIGTGICVARGAAIATLDADLQNDPADLPGLWEIVKSGRADLAQGLRSPRRDPAARRAAAAVGRLARRVLLNDTTQDTGCATRVFTTELGKRFPLHFRGMHRFLPVYARMLGARVVEVPVNHRPRRYGRSKYGVWNRAVSGLVDCLAVRWMLLRYRPPGG